MYAFMRVPSRPGRSARSPQDNATARAVRAWDALLATQGAWNHSATQ